MTNKHGDDFPFSGLNPVRLPADLRPPYVNLGMLTGLTTDILFQVEMGFRIDVDSGVPPQEMFDLRKDYQRNRFAGFDAPRRGVARGIVGVGSLFVKSKIIEYREHLAEVATAAVIESREKVVRRIQEIDGVPFTREQIIRTKQGYPGKIITPSKENEWVSSWRITGRQIPVSALKPRPVGAHNRRTSYLHHFGNRRTADIIKITQYGRKTWYAERFGDSKRDIRTHNTGIAIHNRGHGREDHDKYAQKIFLQLLREGMGHNVLVSFS